jgi:hypothetical protein
MEEISSSVAIDNKEMIGIDIKREALLVKHFGNRFKWFFDLDSKDELTHLD